MAFNQYLWLQEQKTSLNEYLIFNKENGTNYDELFEKLMTDIDNDCIYYNDCWDICKVLAPCNEWDKMELGPITSLAQLAYATLYDFAMSEINLQDMIDEFNYEEDEAE
jgi:hypothetical protein